MKVSNIVSGRGTTIPNQFEIRSEEGLTFQSYESECATIDHKGNLTLGKDWDYSNTTMKYLYVFLRDNKYALSLSIREEVINALDTNNKRKALQNLIDQGIIKYDREMR